MGDNGEVDPLDAFFQDVEESSKAFAAAEAAAESEKKAESTKRLEQIKSSIQGDKERDPSEATSESAVPRENTDMGVVDPLDEFMADMKETIKKSEEKKTSIGDLSHESKSKSAMSQSKTGRFHEKESDGVDA